MYVEKPGGQHEVEPSGADTQYLQDAHVSTAQASALFSIDTTAGEQIRTALQKEAHICFVSKRLDAEFFRARKPLLRHPCKRLFAGVGALLFSSSAYASLDTLMWYDVGSPWYG